MVRPGGGSGDPQRDTAPGIKTPGSGQWDQDSGIRDVTEIMASNHRHSGRDGNGSGSSDRRAPEWADGLKQLYDSVVEEDLPDSFKHLLDQLDAIDPDRGNPSGRSITAPSADGRDTAQ
jgi:hypothetical protein